MCVFAVYRSTLSVIVNCISCVVRVAPDAVACEFDDLPTGRFWGVSREEGEAEVSIMIKWKPPPHSRGILQNYSLTFTDYKKGQVITRVVVDANTTMYQFTNLTLGKGCSITRHLSLCAYHYVPITMCLSLCAYHYVPITVCLSLRAYHYVPITTCLSLRAYHYVPITTCLSLRAYHYVPITTCLSLRAYHYMPITICLSLCAYHGVPITVCLSLCAYHYVPITVCLSL